MTVGAQAAKLDCEVEALCRGTQNKTVIAWVPGDHRVTMVASDCVTPDCIYIREKIVSILFKPLLFWIFGQPQPNFIPAELRMLVMLDKRLCCISYCPRVKT